VSDPLPPALAGKGKRVAGVFASMIGASIILDTHLTWLGLPILAVGVALFAWGIAEARAPEPLAAPHSDATTEMRP
jgi:hypothetical protein